MSSHPDSNNLADPKKEVIVEGRPINEWISDRRIESGSIMGQVRTNKVGSECYFEIMPLKEFKEQASEGDFEEPNSFEEIAKEAMWESGYLEWNF